MCNFRSINNLAKQEDIVHWHKNINNLVLIFMETNDVHVFTLGIDSGYLGLGVAVIMDNSLARYVYKIFEIPGQLFFIKLLFKNKLSVSILGLYAGVSFAVHFSQAGEINFLIAKAVNEFSFIILDNNFNKDGSRRCASYNKCLDLGLINFLDGCLVAKILTWCNFYGVTRMINYLFISSNLVNLIVSCSITDVVDYFNTDHKAIAVSVSLSSLLDKFDVKNANVAKWCKFKNATTANTTMFLDKFAKAVTFSDLDAMWAVVRKIMVFLVNSTFSKKWFKSFNSVFTKEFSRFYKLELLVSKLIKASCSASTEVKSLFISGSSFDVVCSKLVKARKFYCSSKLLKLRHAEEFHIKQAICKRIENFELDKSHIIRSVLEHPFRKMVLNHLVVNKELVLEPKLVKFKIDMIIEGWTRKHQMVNDIYVFDKAFSGVMCSIGFDELYEVVSNLPDGKAAGLSDISNELWKHCDESVLNLLLVLLNFCLACESPSLAKAHSDVHFFINLVLKKVVSDKQFSYLVSAVLYPIVSYRMQFSFVPVGVYNKWDALIHKGLKIKSGLPLDFLSDTIYYSSFYGMVCVLCNCSLSISGSLANLFHGCGGVSMSVALALSSVSSGVGLLNILGSSSFMFVCNHLFRVGTGSLSVYTDGSLKGLGTVGCRTGVAVYFKDIDLGLGIGVSSLMSFTLAEMQAIVLALECVSLASFVHLFSDNQSALDACKLELVLACPNFRN
ncbi:hypothetical protein G9A89_023050 [Geosiphon pyriformis]|nr:hypothetical protein G9A89_023050 [Geosiphon pyriformis]